MDFSDGGDGGCGGDGGGGGCGVGSNLYVSGPFSSAKRKMF